MVHVIFDTSSVAYGDYVQTGAGNGGQSLGDAPTYPSSYYRGIAPYLQQRGYGNLQRGAGLTDVFRGLWKFFLPLVRRVGTTVSEEALKTGQRVLERVSQGAPLKEAMLSESKRGIDTVLDRGGLPKQFGTGFNSGRRKSIKARRNAAPRFTHQTLIGRAVAKPLPLPSHITNNNNNSNTNSRKRPRLDAFGLY